VNNGYLLSLGTIVLALAFAAERGLAAGGSLIEVGIQGPSQSLTMGDTPTFTGRVTNASDQEREGLVVYLSLVSLKPGDEHPVDLEDWSAQKAVRIGQLLPEQCNTQDWTMRLIEAGQFGVALTVVDPKQKQPIVSNLLVFYIQSKPTLNSVRIIPVAIGEPLFLLLLYVLPWGYRRSRGSRGHVMRSSA
jgi:hypothetical protein